MVLPEPWGTWTDGSEAELLFRLESIPDSDLTLAVKGHAFVNEKHPELNIDVIVNDQPVGRWKFKQGESAEEFRLKIPVEVLKAGAMTDLGLLVKVVFDRIIPNRPFTSGYQVISGGWGLV